MSLPFTKEELDQHVLDGLLTCRKHPEFPLSIYNYTPKVAYNRLWDEVTMTCRGLVLDDDFHVLSRPFAKFFNYGEIPLEQIPQRPPDMVSSKLDGSLGIVVQFQGKMFVATRGSFISDQAVWATKFLNKQWPDYCGPEGITTLVEIIYPENRIVVSYPWEDLILLGAIDNETGADIPLWEIDWWPGLTSEIHFDIKSAHDAYLYGTSDTFHNEEGLVLTWYKPNAPSVRCKIKHPRYVELHRVLCGLSIKRIWETLSSGENFEDILEIAPDEFNDWLRKSEAELRSQFAEIETLCKNDFTQTPEGERKKIAEYYKTCKYPGVLFAMLDNKKPDQQIWKLIQPSGSQTYKVDIDV